VVVGAAPVIADYHMHLVGDDDPYTDETFSVAHIEGYVRAAAAAGVDEIAITDHVYRFRQAREWFDHPLWVGDAVEDLGRYHAAVTAAQEADLPVLVGLEVDWLADREQAIRDTLAPYRWDVLLGSVHWVAGLAVDWEEASIWEHHSVAEVWELYIEQLCAAATSGIYDVMAHPDLAKVFGQRPQPRPLELYERVADAFAAAAVCAEVSSAGYGQEMGELYPDPELLAMLHARGVPVTLASDAHAPAGIGKLFERSLAELRRAGYTTITLFRDHEPRQVAFDE
jgi:histidinol-phosphatase (PHP family)